MKQETGLRCFRSVSCVDLEVVFWCQEETLLLRRGGALDKYLVWSDCIHRLCLAGLLCNCWILTSGDNLLPDNCAGRRQLIELYIVVCIWIQMLVYI